MSYIEGQLGIIERMWTLELDRTSLETRLTPTFALIRQFWDLIFKTFYRVRK